MGFVDPATKLSEADLDRAKVRARFSMIAARDGAIWAADTVASRAYNAAQVALLACRTEAEIARVELGFTDGMKTLKEAIDAQA